MKQLLLRGIFDNSLLLVFLHFLPVKCACKILHTGLLEYWTRHLTLDTAGSWNDECEKETPAAPEKRDPMVLDMSLPPPG